MADNMEQFNVNWGLIIRGLIALAFIIGAIWIVPLKKKKR